MSTPDELHEIIAHHMFFNRLSERHLSTIRGLAKEVTFPSGENLFLEGEPANLFYLITSGRIVIRTNHAQHGAISIQTLEAGDILGWSWLIPPHYWRFDGQATQDATAIALDGSKLRKECEADAELGCELLKRFSSVLADRLAATRIQLLDIFSSSTET